MGEYKFDLNNMKDTVRDEATSAAQQTTHMEERAGEIMAELLLPVKDHLQAALRAADELDRFPGSVLCRQAMMSRSSTTNRRRLFKRG